MRDRVVDRAALRERGVRAADAQVDHLRTVVDRVDDAGRLVDVAERSVTAPGADDVHRRSLRGEIRCREIGAGVDDRDRDSGRRSEHPVGHRVEARRGVLPLVNRVARTGEERGLDLRLACRERLDVLDARTCRDRRRECRRRGARTQLCGTDRGQPADDERGVCAERRSKVARRAVADDDGAVCPSARRGCFLHIGSPVTAGSRADANDPEHGYRPDPPHQTSI